MILISILHDNIIIAVLSVEDGNSIKLVKDVVMRRVSRKECKRKEKFGGS